MAEVVYPGCEDHDPKMRQRIGFSLAFLKEHYPPETYADRNPVAHEVTEECREKRRVSAGRYRRKNPGLCSARNQLKRSRHGKWLSSELGPVMDKLYSRRKCHWCREFVKRRYRHIDHIVPPARGGTNAPHNLCMACSGCNHRKGAKLPSDWGPQPEFPLC